MDAVEMLTSDHRKVETIFQQFEQGINLSQAVQLFRELYQELTLHALAEENVFYPALARNPQFSSQLKESFKEHSEVKAIFGELAALDMTSSEWLDKMSRLIKDVKSHVKSEENELFPAARQFLSGEELQKLAQELQKAKDLSREAVANSFPMQEINQTSMASGANIRFETFPQSTL